MNAGGELDALVAERVMGWHRVAYNLPGLNLRPEWLDADGKETGRFAEGGGGDYYVPDEEWEPSKRVDHAWEVVERLHQTFEWVKIVSTADGASVTIQPFGETRPVKSMERTAALAICHAALYAMKAPA